MADPTMTDAEMLEAWFSGTLWKNLWRINHKEDIADKLRAKYAGDTIEAYD